VSQRYARLEFLRSLDPERDCERICNLSMDYEFPWDFSFSLSLALFRTYGVPAISAILAATGELEQRTIKRLVDTSLLLRQIFVGLSTEQGRSALQHLNRIHALYPISNSDYVYTLSSFVVTPRRWIDRYGWRQLSDTEVVASVVRFRRMGQLMGIKEIPETYDGFAQFLDTYEGLRFRFSTDNQKVALATLRARERAVVAPLRVVKRTFLLSVLDPPLLRALGLQTPPSAIRSLVDQLLLQRARLLRCLPPRSDSRPFLGTERIASRFYSNGWTLADLGPEHLCQGASHAADERTPPFVHPDSGCQPPDGRFRAS
jgi:hypothetical protein